MVPCTLQLSKKTLDWWKSIGEGYTSAMARMLEEAQNHPEIQIWCLTPFSVGVRHMAYA